MTFNRLLTAAAAVAMAAAVAPAAFAQTPAAPAAQPAPAPAAAPAAAGAVKPVAVQGDLVDSLRLNGGFNTFLKAVDSVNLTKLLKDTKTLTVFAPTDAAFAAMPPAELARLQGDKTAMQKFLLHHLVNAPIPSSKIKGAKGPVPTPAGDTIMLDGSDEAGALKVDGATIVQADVQTGSGLLQVVDHVLIAGQGAPAETAAAPAAPATGADAAAKAKPKT